MYFRVDATVMTREQEIALENFLEEGDYEWDCVMAEDEE